MQAESIPNHPLTSQKPFRSSCFRFFLCKNSISIPTSKWQLRTLLKVPKRCGNMRLKIGSISVTPLRLIDSLRLHLFVIPVSKCCSMHSKPSSHQDNIGSTRRSLNGKIVSSDRSYSGSLGSKSHSFRCSIVSNLFLYFSNLVWSLVTLFTNTLSLVIKSSSCSTILVRIRIK